MTEKTLKGALNGALEEAGKYIIKQIIIKQIWNNVKKNTPQIMLTAKSTSRKCPKDASDIVKLTNDDNAVYVRCAITNKGKTDIPQVKIYNRKVGHTLHCKPLRRKEEYVFYIKMSPASRELKIIAQNSNNKIYQAVYKVTYYPRNVTTNIASNYGLSRFRYSLSAFQEQAKKVIKWLKNEKAVKKTTKPHSSKGHQRKQL